MTDHTPASAHVEAIRAALTLASNHMECAHEIAEAATAALPALDAIEAEMERLRYDAVGLKEERDIASIAAANERYTRETAEADIASRRARLAQARELQDAPPGQWFAVFREGADLSVGGKGWPTKEQAARPTDPTFLGVISRAWFTAGEK